MRVSLSLQRKPRVSSHAVLISCSLLKEVSHFFSVIQKKEIWEFNELHYCMMLLPLNEKSFNTYCCFLFSCLLEILAVFGWEQVTDFEDCWEPEFGETEWMCWVSMSWPVLLHSCHCRQDAKGEQSNTDEICRHTKTLPLHLEGCENRLLFFFLQEPS